MAFFYISAATLAFLLQSVSAVTALRSSVQSVANDANDMRRLQTPSDGNLKFNEATFIASHNAHANLALAGEDPLLPLGTNQEFPIYNQLAEGGVRGLLVDLELNEEEAEPLRLTHGTGFISLDYGGARSELGANLVPFLEQDPNAIISLFLETDGDTGGDGAAIRASILGHLKDIFSVMTVGGKTLKDMTFKYNDALWQSHSDWPTLDELRSSDQRIFVFTDRPDIADQEFGFMYNRDVLQENNFDGIQVCENRYGWGQGTIQLPFNDYWTRLVLMNHFTGFSGPDSRGDTVGEKLPGGGTNGWGILYNRILDCMSKNGGYKPNFIALDWVVQSQEAREVADFMNFGGKIGTGQTCSDDSHCATSSCNTNEGLCQCQRCLPASEDVCLGCEDGEYCAQQGGGMNICQSKTVGGFQPNPPNPTFDSSNRFYCGGNYTQASKNCYTNTPCPTGAPGTCPIGEVCYSGIVCIAPPTISPTSSIQPTPGATSPKPSASPSSSQPTGSPVLSLGGTGNIETPQGDAASPTASPAATIIENQFYCGANYTNAEENCAEAVKCPGGNEECPMGQVCYFLQDIVCPTPTPSEQPSSSSMPSPKTVVGPTIGEPSPLVPETTLCGTNADETEANCKNAFPCTSAVDCAFLGVEFACFSVKCVGDATPTVGVITSPPTPPPSVGGINPVIPKPTPGGGLLEGLPGLTKVPSPPTLPPLPTTNPTTSPSTMPTEPPFDFSNTFYCGADYDDARDNCYKVNKPCPSGAPETCPNGQVCYDGVTCTAPPTALPTTSPTAAPTKSPQPPGVGDQTGGRPNNMPAPAPQFGTNAPFDDSAWGPFPPTDSAAANSFVAGMIFWVIAFGFAGLLI